MKNLQTEMRRASDKRFFVGMKRDGTKEVVWNWPSNIHDGVYPEYVSWEGPFDVREQAEKLTAATRKKP